MFVGWMCSRLLAGLMTSVLGMAIEGHVRPSQAQPLHPLAGFRATPGLVPFLGTGFTSVSRNLT